MKEASLGDSGYARTAGDRRSFGRDAAYKTRSVFYTVVGNPQISL